MGSVSKHDSSFVNTKNVSMSKSSTTDYSMSNGNGTTGKKQWPLSSKGSSKNGFNHGSSSSPRPRDGRPDSYSGGETSYKGIDSSEDTLKLKISDFPAYNERHGWQSPSYKVSKGKVQPRIRPPTGKPTRHTNKLDYILHHVLKALRNHHHGWPFVRPVCTLEIPNIHNYYDIVKRPMDLGTVESRIRNLYYVSSAECLSDINQVFENCVLVNPPEFPIYDMALLLQKFVDDLLQDAPTKEYTMSPTWKISSKKNGRSDPDSRNSSMVSSFIGESRSIKRKSEVVLDSFVDGIDLKKSRLKNRPMPDYSRLPPRWTKSKYSLKMNGCVKIMSDLLTKKQYRACASPFAFPVDVEGYNLYDYYEVVQNPMDLGSIKKKLDYKQYANVEEFRSDFLLMIRNCFAFNRKGDEVHCMGIKLLAAFDERFADLPNDDSFKKTLKTPTTASLDMSHSSIHQAAVSPAATVNSASSYSAITYMESLKKASSTPISLVPQTLYDDCHDDEVIEGLTYWIRNEILRLTERVALLQLAEQEALNARMCRFASLTAGITPLPPMKAETITRIMNLFEVDAYQPKPFPVLKQFQLEELRSKGFSVPLMPRADLKPMPKVTSQQFLETPSVPVERPRSATVRPPSASFTTPLPLTDTPMGASNTKRGRKKGSKNKPKYPEDKDEGFEFYSDDEQSMTPMTYDEKRVLSMNINNLPVEELTKVVNIIEYRENIGTVDPNEVEIDFETLKPVTLRNLDAFVGFLMKKRTTTKGNEFSEATSSAKSDEWETKKKRLENRLMELATTERANAIPALVTSASPPTPPKPKAIEVVAPVLPEPVAQQKPEKEVTPPLPKPMINEPNLSSSDSSSSDSSSSESDSDSDSDEEVPREEWSSTPKSLMNGTAEKKPINSLANGTSKYSTPESNGTPSSVHRDSSLKAYNNGKLEVEMPRSTNAPRPSKTPQTSQSLKSYDPLSLLDQPSVSAKNTPLPKNDYMYGSPLHDSHNADNYNSFPRVDLGSQIALMANFEEDF